MRVIVQFTIPNGHVRFYTNFQINFRYLWYRYLTLKFDLTPWLIRIVSTSKTHDILESLQHPSILCWMESISKTEQIKIKKKNNLYVLDKLESICTSLMLQDVYLYFRKRGRSMNGLYLNKNDNKNDNKDNTP